MNDEHLPPAQPPEEKQATPTDANQKRAGGIGAAIASLGLLLAKSKALLAILSSLKFVAIFGKLFALSWTFILSLWLYVVVFGWRFAIVIMGVLLLHELGHYFAFRAFGLPARLPQFVPFLGAYTVGAVAPDLEQDALIALAGPLAGLALAALCYAIGVTFHDPFWLAVASVSAFLNLFNMLPVPPFDGGRIIGALWPPLWLLGSFVFVGVAIWLHVPLLFVVLIALLGAPAMIAAFRGRVDPRAATLTFDARLRISLWYLGTLLGLIFVLSGAPVIPGHMTQL